MPVRTLPSGKMAEVEFTGASGFKPLAVVFEVQAMYASSSIGRAAVSKTAGWGFKSLLACHFPEERDG
jgi:hypothetical protein